MSEKEGLASGGYVTRLIYWLAVFLVILGMINAMPGIRGLISG